MLDNLIVLGTEAVSGEGLDTVTNLMTGVFDKLKGSGLKLVAAAVGVGVIFLGAKWLWGKARMWIANM